MQPVLVILESDLKSPQPALHKAVYLATQLRRPLVIAVNVYSAGLVRATQGDAAHLEKGRAALSQVWQRRIDELLAGCEALPDAPARQLLWERDDETALRITVLEHLPWLTVVHVDEVPGLARRLFLTPRHWLLLRKAPGAVMCVSGHRWNQPPRVLAAVDPDHDAGQLTGLNAEIVRLARELSDALDTSLDLGHVVEHPDDTLLMVSTIEVPIPPQVIDLQSYYADRLRQLCEQAGLGSEHQILLEGVPAEALSQWQAEHEPALLVLGTVRKDPLRRLLFGATAERIALQASGDFVAVKHEDFQSPWLD